LLTAFTAAVQASSDNWLATGSNGSAACGLTHLGKWAAAGALQGNFTEQAKANRRFNLAGLSVAYLALRHSPASSGSAAVIGQWFEDVALVCAADESRLENNLLYWLGAGLCGSAIANQNAALFTRGVAMARRGIAEIAADGSLPREVARGPRALTYHSFALSPLLMVAELALANGVDLYGENNAGLQRLTKFTIANIVDSSNLAEMAGAPQIWTGSTDNTVPWIEMARTRFADSWLVENAHRLSPVKYPFLGGNQTLLFGSGRRASKSFDVSPVF
jgi:poly(beta-D-mannuronate) lyase